MDKARNDLSAAVPKFCLALEEHRRTPDGRVRTSQELLSTFFPYDEKQSTDKLFKFLPNDVRGPIIAAWGIRGIKAALRDNDERAQQVVWDALVAGDIDHAAFEEGLIPETLVRWVPLGDLWAFWRGGKVTKQAIHKAIVTAYELYLFDARWFLDTINSRGGALKGTDVLSDQLTKDDLTQWVRRIHETGDGTPKGLVTALGWDKIVGKTANDVLIAVLDAMVVKVGLVAATPTATGTGTGLPAVVTPGVSPTSKSEAKAEPKADAKIDLKTEFKTDTKPEAGAGSTPSLSLGGDLAQADISWTSKPPPPDVSADVAVPSPVEEAINVTLDEDVVVTDRPLATAPRIRPPAAEEEEDTEVKRLAQQRRTGPPPLRGPTPPRR